MLDDLLGQRRECVVLELLRPRPNPIRRRLGRRGENRQIEREMRETVMHNAGQLGPARFRRCMG